MSDFAKILDDPIALTEKLIAFPTISPARGEVFDYVTQLLQEIGFTVTRLPFGESTDWVDNLYAEYSNHIADDHGHHIAFCGHLDVVPAGDETAWQTLPFMPKQSEGRLYGRGSTDMKSAIAAYLVALARFLRSGPAKQNFTLSLIITGDEEDKAIQGTEKIVAWMREQHKKIDFCITGEPTSEKFVGDTAKIGRRGSMNAVLSVFGKQGHIAYPEKSINAAHALVPILQALIDTPLDAGNEFFQASKLQISSIDIGNPITNISPGVARACFNIRFNNIHQAQGLQKWLHNIIATKIENLLSACELPDGKRNDLENTILKWHLEIVSAQEAFFCAPTTPYHKKLAKAVHKITNKKLTWSTRGGISDSRFLAPDCVVVDFGLCNDTMHQINESVALEDITTLCAIYQKALHSLIVSSA